jgi:hypothetical protein
MKTLNWRHTDWNARNFIFSVGQEIVGQLTFYSSWNFNATYTDNETKIKFTQKSFWDKTVSITKNGESVGKIVSGFFTHPTLILATSKKFVLSSNAWGRNVNWKSESGETIIKYEQASMRSMGKGLIILNDSLTLETERLLISSGLFIKQYIHKRAALMVAIMIPIIAASNR